MAESQDRTEEAALWRRWRSAAAPGAVAALDPLLLAAYAEDRLGGAELDAVEEWLTAHPMLADDILAARRAAQAALPETPPAMAARAAALVREAGVQILAFRRPAPRWRTAAAWGGMAASLMVTSLVGFTLGNDAYVSFAGSAPATLSQELLDPPTGLFNSPDEDSAI
jgi:hypothetical protein